MKIKKILLLLLITVILFGCTLPENPNKDKEEHVHEYVEGKCPCGAIDPNEQIHIHKFIEGVCECGKVDPNYQEPGLEPEEPTTPEEPSDDLYKDVELSISINNSIYYELDNIIVDIEVNKKELINHIELVLVENTCDVEIIKNVIIPQNSGQINLVAKFETVVSNEITIDVNPTIYTSDLYQNMNKDDFYDSFYEAINYQDALLRTQLGLMSGSIETPDETPITANYQPMSNGKYIRNTNTYFSKDNNTYFITDAYGEIVDMVFKKAGYISLDEVAAHLLAFGTIPGNYDSNKKASPSSSIWKEYLRVNNTKFSGSTSKYPYEPKLPNISGCGGSLQYYEIDFGTTGTTCDPDYNITIYNNGSKITRGAARLVYTSYDLNNNKTLEPNERYVFYTYNHYNDFQEYLNYQYGWGEIFGNITGGGTLSSKTDYNPTPYVETVLDDFSRPLELEYIFFEIKALIKEEE